MKKLLEQHYWVCGAAALFSIVMFGFIRFPYPMAYGTAGLLMVMAVVATVEHFKPAAEGTFRRNLFDRLKAPSLVLFTAGLTGFLTLTLLISPIVWGAVAGYALLCFMVSSGLAQQATGFQLPDEKAMSEWAATQPPLSAEETARMNELRASHVIKLKASELDELSRLEARLKFHGRPPEAPAPCTVPA